MNLLQSLREFIAKEDLFQPKDRLVIAVSGGVDSVVLCELCYRCGFDFAIAHCNFQLRGEESDRDEAFVEGLSKKYKAELYIKRFDTEKYALKNRIGIQEGARKLRYEWFAEIINSSWPEEHEKPEKNGKKAVNARRISPPPRYILTAHHANDNIETLLMNFFRGTGITGLRGILPKQGNIVRPLLFATKEEIMQFAAENDLTFAEDSSNLSSKYTRNYFRNELIPAVQKVFPQAEDNLKDNLQRFREIEILYNQSVAAIKKKLAEHKGEEVHIPVLKLLQTRPLFTIVYEILKDYNFTPRQTDEVIHLLAGETGKYIRSSSHRALKNRNWLIISPNQTASAQHIPVEEKDASIYFAGGTLTFEKLPASRILLPAESHVASLDADAITFPLLLRKWKQGDYFYPLGMSKKKKLSRFFIDLKMSMVEKENAWIIEMDKKIIWVVGRRIDDRFKVTAKTKELLQISWS